MAGVFYQLELRIGQGRGKFAPLLGRPGLVVLAVHHDGRLGDGGELAGQVEIALAGQPRPPTGSAAASRAAGKTSSAALPVHRTISNNAYHKIQIKIRLFMIVKDS